MIVNPGSAGMSSGVTAAEAYRLIAELTSDCAYSMVVNDGNLRLEWVTEGFTKVTGFTIAEVEERGGWPTLIHPDSAAAAKTALSTLLGGDPLTNELKIVTKSGSPRWVRATTQVARDHDGTVVRIFGVAQDITEEKRAKEALEEYQARLVASFEEAAIGVAIVLPDGHLTAVNPELARMLGLSRDAMVGREVCEFTVAEDLDLVRDLPTSLAAEPGGKKRVKVRFRHSDGNHVVGRVSASLVRTPSGDPDYVVTQVADVTEHHETLELLRQRESMLASAERLARIGSWSWNGVTDEVVWSDELYRMFGLRPGEFSATYDAYLQLVHPDDRPAVQGVVSRAAADHQPFGFYHRVVRASDGEIRTFSCRGEVAVDADGSFVRMFGTALDVTDRMKVEAARAEETARSSLLSRIARASNTSPTAEPALETALAEVCLFTGWDVGHCFLVDEDDDDTLVSSDLWFQSDDTDIEGFRSETESARLIAVDDLPGQVLGTRSFVSVPDISIEPAFSRGEAAAACGIRSGHAFPVMSGNDVLAVLEFFSFARSEVDEDLEDLMSTVGVQLGRAVERERAAKDVARRQQQLEEAQLMASMGSWEWEPARDSFLYSKGLLTMLALPPDADLSFADLQKFVHPDDLEDLVTTRERLAASGGGLLFQRFRLVLPDASKKVIETRVLIEPDADGKVGRIVAVDQDVTDRKRAERLLESQAAVLQKIALREPLDDVLDRIATGIEHEASGVRCSIQLVQDGVLRHGAGPSLPDAYNEAIDGIAVAEGAGSCGTSAFRREEVVTIDVETDPLWSDFVGLAAEHDLRACWSSPIFSEGREVIGTFALYYATPREPSALERNLVEVFSGLASVAIETGRAEATAARLEAQYRQVQKMQAVGQLAGGVAHDFNNLLQAIVTSGEALSESLLPDDPRRENVDTVLAGARRGAALVRQLLLFSRRDQLSPCTLDLNRTIKELTPLIRATLGESIELNISLDPAGPHVEINPGSFEQILLNLVSNARDAAQRGGTVWIETTTSAPDAASPGTVSVTVRDDGPGIEPEVAARVFEPFFTTKAPGGGSGLGLASVYGATEAAGGHVRVDTAPGAGAAFIVELPARVPEEPTSAPPVAPLRPRDAPRRGTILLAEDEPIVAESLQRMLTKRGYGVLSAADGPEALETALADATPIELLVTDVVMPGMSGPEVVRRLRAAGRSLRVLYMSGYSEDVLDHDELAAHGDRYISKPFSPDELVAVVEELLDPLAGDPKEVSRSDLPGAGQLNG